MTYSAWQLDRFGSEEEATRVAELVATGILDTPPEATYDAITRLAVNFFQVDSAGIAFADNSRVWIKSSWGKHCRELPRTDSLFELVLAENGPVVIPDTSRISRHSPFPLIAQLLGVRFVAGVPIRSAEERILGVLAIFGRKPRNPLSPDEIHVLESMCRMVSRDLELRRIENNSHNRRECDSSDSADAVKGWPRISDLQSALDEKQFTLHFQPEIDLLTGEIVCLEALIRWEHPERGVIPPSEFIPRAEESGLILPIGDWVLSATCEQIRKWRAEDPRRRSLRVAVNLSARQFARVGLADHIQALLMKFGVPSQNLCLEMTEASLIPNSSTAAEVLASLHALGVTLLLDDFGTGYSSLNYLHSFPFDALKIDRSFVERLNNGEQPVHIVRTILELARVLEMDVIAEGIETHEQRCLLRRMGCHLGQGYLFARPMPAEDITLLFRVSGQKLLSAHACEPCSAESTFSKEAMLVEAANRQPSKGHLDSHADSTCGIDARVA